MFFLKSWLKSENFSEKQVILLICTVVAIIIGTVLLESDSSIFTWNLYLFFNELCKLVYQKSFVYHKYFILGHSQTVSGAVRKIII